MTQKILLAVYGSLKRGQPLNGMLTEARYIGTTLIKDYVMQHCGGYPAAVQFNGYYVVAEVFEVSDKILTRIDKVEGTVNNLFSRILINTVFGDVWVYTRTSDKLTINSKIVPDGLWKGSGSRLSPWLGAETEARLKKLEALRNLTGAQQITPTWATPFPPIASVPRPLTWEETITQEINSLPKDVTVEDAI